MNSNDVITNEVFNARMDALMSNIRLENEKLHNEIHNEIQEVKTELINEFQKGFSTLQAEIRVVDTKVQVNSAKIEMLQHTFYWGFGIMAVVVALIPYFRREQKQKEEKKNSPVTIEQVQELIDSAIAKALRISER